MWVAGRRAVMEAIRAGRATEVLIGDWAKPVRSFSEIREAASNRSIPVRVVPWVKLDEIDANHRGVVARVGRAGEISERTLSDWDFGEVDVVVVLDGVTDPQNLGAA